MKGTRGLSLRAVANEMGGSTTLITHYFPTQRDLLDYVSAHLIATWDEEVSELDANEDTPTARLQALLYWLGPTTEDGYLGERIRIHLLVDQLLGDENRTMFESSDAKIRGLIRTHVEDLIHPGNVERVVELLRVTTDGVVLSIIEHPDLWPPERQIAIIDWLMESLQLTPVDSLE